MKNKEILLNFNKEELSQVYKLGFSYVYNKKKYEKTRHLFRSNNFYNHNKFIDSNAKSTNNR